MLSDHPIRKSEEMKTMYIDTNGCDEARLETQKLKNLLNGTDYVCTDDARLADVIVFYACGHLRKYEDESITTIKRLIRLKKKSAVLVVWGCLSEINRNAVESVHKGPIIGPENWDYFSSLLDMSKERMSCVHANRLSIQNNLIRPRFPSVGAILNLLYDVLHYQSRKIWYIKIESGCKERCTFCSDHLAFKGVRSEPMDAIISQFELGLEMGYKHFSLIGRDLGSYGADAGYDLPALLSKILENHRHQDYKLILENMSPKSLVELYPRLSSSFLDGKILKIGTHIQSGSGRILRLMGRRFSVREWLRIMKEINKNFPNVRLVTSIMVGFPTETEQDLGKSMLLLDEQLFDEVDLYKYEERPNLASLRLSGRVPNRVKETRYKMVKRKIIICNIRKRIRKFQIFYLLQSLMLNAIQSARMFAQTSQVQSQQVSDLEGRLQLVHSHKEKARE
jgi:ribosomal protein S12 methylthiotransferase